ncbi:MAG TPA: 5'/3'-nucleotidase SurE [Chloroflexota bacterium]|nr:5'/3'-nucleotidase SurE [Chloroflexota bacterium]
MILVTNDDGVDSPGLSALARALRAVEDVCVIAPNRNWTAAGHTKTLDRPLRVTQIKLPGTRIPAFASDGTPSDCVALGFLGVAPERPRLVVSGINTGPNLGSDITYSGTVSAAMESVVSGVPAIAVSLADPFQLDFRYAASFAARLARRLLRANLANDVLLNVNVPAGRRKDIKGVQVTRLGRRDYNDELIRRQDPFGRDYFWIGGAPPGGTGEPGTDLHAIAAGYVSITPVQLDLTNHDLIEHIARWRLIA